MNASNWTTSDYDLREDVRDELAWDPRLNATHVNVAVKGGLVTLSGTVDTWAERYAACKAAHRVCGVRGVVDDLRLPPATSASRSDFGVHPQSPTLSSDAVRRAIEVALDRHATHAARHVHITVAHDKVTLDGQVPSWAERRAIEGAVRSTAGVKSVDNHLRIQA